LDFHDAPLNRSWVKLGATVKKGDRALEFPRLLDLVDDLPPTTVITHVRVVNGREAKAMSPNFVEWETVLSDVNPGGLKLSAHAEDAAGNVENRPHTIAIH